MSMGKEMKPQQQAETRFAEVEAAGSTDAHAPRKLTFAENIILTIKILAGFGSLGIALWGLSLWTSPR